jgi:hypothetical protein
MRSAAKVDQHGERAPVVVIGRLQAELDEDGRGVPGHGALGDEQPLGDGGVRAVLRHQGEHLALARAIPVPEGGWLLALAVVLLAATVWLVRRRAA